MTATEEKEKRRNKKMECLSKIEKDVEDLKKIIRQGTFFPTIFNPNSLGLTGTSDPNETSVFSTIVLISQR